MIFNRKIETCVMKLIHLYSKLTKNNYDFCYDKVKLDDRIINCRQCLPKG